MKEIPLTRGKVALVDDEDFERLNQHKWFVHKRYKIFYAGRNISLGGNKGCMRVEMPTEILGVITGKEIDHIDGNGLNNQKSNLRFVTHRQNLQNRHDNKASPYPGVSWHKSHKKWQALVRIGGVRKHLGHFTSDILAYEAYKNELRKNGESVINE